MKTNLLLRRIIITRTNAVARLWISGRLCALLAAANAVCAQTTNYFYEGFETAQALDDWTISSGTWEIGVPTFGPLTNLAGQRAFAGTKCAATVLGGNYSEGVSSRLESKTIVVPGANQNPRLRFWSWYSFNCSDFGQVQIRVGSGSWAPLTNATFVPQTTFRSSSSGAWSEPGFDLSAYAGQSVQIGFYFESHNDPSCLGGLVDVSPGWYLDEVRVVTGPVTFDNPDNFESGFGDWHVDGGTWEVGLPTSGPGGAHEGTNCVATVLAGNYTDDSSGRLVSPPFLVPPAITNPRLRFWHWYDFNCGDSGQVQLRLGTNNWQTLSNANYTSTSSGAWSRPGIDLSGYAGQSVQIGFYFESHNDPSCLGGLVDVAPGWYVDEVRLLHDFALLLLDSPIVRAQDTFCVSLGIAASSPASSVSFTLQAPAGNLGNVTLNGTGCWTNAIITPQPDSRWLVTLQNNCTNTPMGVQTVGSICFTAVSAHSAFVALTISNLVVTDLDASIPATDAFGSRAVIIANEPLLEATVTTNRQRMLTLFGKRDARYEIHHVGDLGGAAAWSAGWTNTVPTSMLYSFPIDGSFSDRPALYLRALEK